MLCQVKLELWVLGYKEQALRNNVWVKYISGIINGLKHIFQKKGLGLVSVSTSKSLGLVSVLVLSGLGNVLALVGVVLTTTLLTTLVKFQFHQRGTTSNMQKHLATHHAIPLLDCRMLIHYCLAMQVSQAAAELTGRHLLLMWKVTSLQVTSRHLPFSNPKQRSAVTRVPVCAPLNLHSCSVAGFASRYYVN